MKPEHLNGSPNQLVEKWLQLRQEAERFTGMPTLDYDEILEEIECKMIDIESTLSFTCCGCGGERLAITEGVWVPENGLCAKELDECHDCPSTSCDLTDPHQEAIE